MQLIKGQRSCIICKRLIEANTTETPTMLPAPPPPEPIEPSPSKTSTRPQSLLFQSRHVPEQNKGSGQLYKGPPSQGHVIVGQNRYIVLLMVNHNAGTCNAHCCARVQAAGCFCGLLGVLHCRGQEWRSTWAYQFKRLRHYGVLRLKHTLNIHNTHCMCRTCVLWPQSPAPPPHPTPHTHTCISSRTVFLTFYL